MLSSTRLSLAAVLVSLAIAGAAHADDAPPQASYHLQLAATDAVGAAAFFGGAGLKGTTGDVLMGTGGATYLLGGPIIHVLHGNYGRAAVSLGLRVLLPIIAAKIAVGMSTCNPQNEDSGDVCVGAKVGGLMLGAATAAVADALLVAPWAGATEPPRQAPPRLSLAPQIVASADRAMLGVAARF